MSQMRKPDPSQPWEMVSCPIVSLSESQQSREMRSDVRDHCWLVTSSRLDRKYLDCCRFLTLLTLQTPLSFRMDFLTIVVRWGSLPTEHINFLKDFLLKWCVSRWTYTGDSTEHLTVICVQIPSEKVVAYLRRLIKTMTSLWTEPLLTSMVKRDLDPLLADKVSGLSNVSWYNVCHTDASTVSFYEHVTNTWELMTRNMWTMLEDKVLTDDRTEFQLNCIHEDHSVTIYEKHPVVKMRNVLCREPQTIFDLMKKNNVLCSTVWDFNISLSAKSPCTALREHRMTVVHVNSIPRSDVFCKVPELSPLYHNMMHLTAQADVRTLRHNPFHTANPQHELQDEQRTYISVGLCYNSVLSTVNEIVQADGRFIKSVCYKTSDGEPCGSNMAILELEHTNSLVLTVADQPDPDEDNEEEVPVRCLACFSIPNIYYECGHLCCKNCVEKISNRGKFRCCVCKNPVSHKPLYIPAEFTFTCPLCMKQKQWIAECGHVICPCLNGLCTECGKPVTKLTKMFA